MQTAKIAKRHKCRHSYCPNHVRVSVENNPLWNSTGKQWQTAWDDNDARGYDRDRKFDDVLYAKRFADRFLRMFFPKCHFKHKIDFLGAASRRTWFGKYKEGD